ncbi:MAG: hypothetical protein HRU75_14340 [Planctomycetia bacterium]|nr:MAG: hypothetical protein HRU75_14340 [Planctomycetia bacterium]
MPRLIATQWLAPRVGCAAAVLLVIAPLPGIAAVLHVPADYPTIAAAVAAATSTDEVHVGPGVYTERLDLSSRRLTLRATAGPAFTTIDGEGLGTVITWTNAVSGSVLEGFQIINGRGAPGAAGQPTSGFQNGAAGRAGGLRASGVLVVRNCVFMNNVGGAGGDGADSIVGQFDAGHGGTGGAGAVSADGPDFFGRIYYCTFYNNSGGRGGAAGRGHVLESQPGLAGLAGPGALAMSGPTPTPTLCSFLANFGGTGGRGADASQYFNLASQAGMGGSGGAGAVAMYGGQPTLANCLFARNQGGSGGEGGAGATPDGGSAVPGAIGGSGGAGVISTSTALTTRSCTLVENAGGTGGTGGAMGGGAGSNGPSTALALSSHSIRNTVFHLNAGPQFAGSMPIGSNCASDFVLVGGANVAFAGEFVHGYRPGPGSPLIDRGHVFDLPMDTLDVDGDFLTGESLPVDLAGISRRIDDPAVADTGVGPPPMPDIGAYERLPTFTVTAGDMNCDGRFDNYDIDVFVLALVQPVVYGHVHRNCSLLAGDFDADGALTNFDIDAFVAALLE